VERSERRKRPRRSGSERRKRTESDRRKRASADSERKKRRNNKTTSRGAARPSPKSSRKQERGRLLEALSETRSERHSRGEARGIEEDTRKIKLEDALVNAWGDTAKRDEEGRTRRHGPPVAPPEPSRKGPKPPAGEEPGAAPSGPAEAIPRAARPSSSRMPTADWTPEPGQRPASSVDARLKIIVAGLAVGILYLGVSGRLAQSELEKQLSSIKEHDEKILQTEQTRSQRILQQQGSRLSGLEKRLVQANERITELTTAREQAVERGDRLEHELGGVRSQLSRSEAEQGRLEASLKREQQARAEGEEARGKLDAKISELEALRTRLEAQAKDLSQRLAGRETVLGKLREEFTTNVRRLEELMAEAKELANERDQAMASAEELNQELSAQSKALATLQAAEQRRQAELTKLRSALAESERKLMELQPRQVPLSLVHLDGGRRAGNAAGPLTLAAGQRGLLEPPGDANRLFEAARKGTFLLALRLRAEGACTVGVHRGERDAPVGEVAALTPTGGWLLLDAAALGGAHDTAFVVSSAEGATVSGATLFALPLSK
jgi:hypothetical protein